MTPKEFLDLSTKLCTDLKQWMTESARDATLTTEHLATLNSAIEIIEQVTVKTLNRKPH